MSGLARLALCTLLLALGGCSLWPFGDEQKARVPAGVPKPPRDLASIPDAVPREEPRSRYGNPQTYVVFGQRYRVKDSAKGHVERGLASWYGPGFHNERTSSGEPYDMYAMTAAHKTLPLPTYLQVTNLDNGRSVVVRVNDRGPFVRGRIIDLSYTAAWKLDMIKSGTARVEIRTVEPKRWWRREQEPPLTAPLRTAAANAPSGTAANRAEAASARYLQAGAFSSRSNAEGMLTQLRQAGFNNSVIREALVAGRRIFRVQVGPVSDENAAEDIINGLRRAGIPDARVMLD
jgi:rare lipoprotein A